MFSLGLGQGHTNGCGHVHSLSPKRKMAQPFGGTRGVSKQIVKNATTLTAWAGDARGGRLSDCQHPPPKMRVRSRPPPAPSASLVLGTCQGP